MTPAQRRRILVPGDVDFILELDRSFLRREGFELLVACDGEETLAVIRRERPEVVLLDPSLPGVDAAGICRLVKAEPALRPTLVLVALAAGADADRGRCGQAGCDGFLDRPLSPELFLTTVRDRLSVVDRSGQRVSARLLIRLSDEDGEVLSDYTVNVSTGGVFVETARAFAAGDPLRTSFFLPDRGQPVHCRSRVAWVNGSERPIRPSLPAGVGLQFLDLADEDRAAILAFVKRQLVSPVW